MRSDRTARLKRTWRTVLAGLDIIKERRTDPPPGYDDEFGRLLWRNPAPLINPRDKMLVIWSAKSACTSVMIWFLHHLGHLRAARDFHIWPHDYRDYVYQFSELYRESYRLDFRAFKVIRVVRDPYERAASSFRHMLGNGFGHDDIGKRLRYRNIGTTGLSFAVFLDCLERSDLTRCNPHYRIQRHPIEDILPVHHLINVSRENLFTRLNEVEADLGLPRSDIGAEPWLQELQWHRRPRTELKGDDLDTRVLTREQALHGPWPRAGALLTPTIRERLDRLYAVDIQAYR